MKTKKALITIIVILLTLATIATAVFFAREDTGKTIQKENESVTDVSSKIESDKMEIESVDNGENTVSKDEGEFIEPDETEADKLLEEHSSKMESSVNSETKEDKTTESKTESVVSETISKPVESKPQKEKEEDNETQTFEEGKKELEDTANDYLKKNNIDPKTAGETGELCPNCSKKIWNPDKYGFFIPGMPDDYENSGYCLGTCGITLE